MNVGKNFLESNVLSEKRNSTNRRLFQLTSEIIQRSHSMPRRGYQDFLVKMGGGGLYLEGARGVDTVFNYNVLIL